MNSAVGQLLLLLRISYRGLVVPQCHFLAHFVLLCCPQDDRDLCSLSIARGAQWDLNYYLGLTSGGKSGPSITAIMISAHRSDKESCCGHLELMACAIHSCICSKMLLVISYAMTSEACKRMLRCLISSKLMEDFWSEGHWQSSLLMAACLQFCHHVAIHSPFITSSDVFSLHL